MHGVEPGFAILGMKVLCVQERLGMSLGIDRPDHGLVTFESIVSSAGKKRRDFGGL